MKLRIGIVVLMAACVMPLVACTDDDDAIESQRSDIVRYLTSTHVPRLISAEDAESSLEVDPPFYDAIDRVVYRYIYNYYDEGRDERSLVEWGDEVELTYTAYVFTGGVPRIESIYASNDADVIEALVEEGLNAKYWSSEPLRVKLGTTSIIKGVALSLDGCREGDEVEAYMTFDAAYGDDVVGIVPKESAVLWVYSVDKVNKGRASAVAP